MATFVKDIAFFFIYFIWQSHLISTALAVEKSPEHEAGYLGSEKYTSLCLSQIWIKWVSASHRIHWNETRRESSCSGDILLSKTHNQLFLLEIFCLSHCTVLLLYQMRKGSYKQQATSWLHTLNTRCPVYWRKEWPVVKIVCDLINKRLYHSTYIPGVWIKFSQAAWVWVLSTFWLF